jgi:ankyrin repeat protein
MKHLFSFCSRTGLVVLTLGLIMSLLLGSQLAQATAVSMADAKRAMMLRDYVELARILQQLAEAGDVEARYQLATLYRSGQGVPQDLEKAAIWAARAAIDHHAGARYLLASLCERGVGCDALQQQQLSAQLYQQAAEEGYAPAQQRQTQSAPLPSQQGVDDWWAAARRGDTATLAQLQKSGVALDQADQQGRTALLLACDSGELATVDWLLAQGANPNQQDNFQDSPLRLAASRGFPEILKHLLKAGADINAQDKGGNSPLLLAVTAEQNAVVGILLAAGANPNSVNQRGDHPLDVAKRRKLVAIETQLLAAGARLPEARVNKPVVSMIASGDEQNLFKGWPSLSVAVWLGQTERVEQLLAQGADVNERGPGGHSALTRAVWRGSEELIGRLLQAGARIDQADDDGRTPLIWSVAETPYPDITRHLLSLGANADRQDKRQMTALMYAARNGSSQAVRWLLAAGAKPDLLDAGQQTALFLALQADPPNLELMRQLLAAGANVNQLDGKGRDPLWFAADGQHAASVALLLGKGAQGRGQDDLGHRAIERCVSRQSLACFRQLLPLVSENSANRQHQTADGNNLLLLAAAQPEAVARPMIEALLPLKLDINQRNQAGDNALMRAAANGNTGVVAVLIQAGADTRMRNYRKQSASELAIANGYPALAKEIDAHGSSGEFWWKLLTGSGEEKAR